MAAKPLLQLAALRVIPLAIVAVVLTWWVSTEVSQEVINQSTFENLALRIDNEAASADERIERVIQAVGAIANNSIITNGLIDVDDRDAYVPGFLESTKLPGLGQTKLGLYDYKVRNISGKDIAPEITKTLSKTIKSITETSQYLIGEDWIIAAPCYLNGNIEGYLLAHYSHDELHKLIINNNPNLNVYHTHDSTPTIPIGMVGQSVPLHNIDDHSLLVLYNPAALNRVADRFQTVTLATLASLLVVVILSLVIMGRLSSKPIAKLANELDTRINEGNLTKDIPEFGQTEINTVITSFNQLVDNLQESTASRDELATAVRNLEIYQEIVINSTDAIMIKSLDGAYLYANPVVEQALNRPLADIIGKTDVELFGNAAQQIMDLERDVATKGEIVTYDEAVPMAGGVRQFRTTRIPLKKGPHGEPAQIGICRDITEDIKRENDLRAEKIRAEAADQAKSRFLATMSHEIRTPMNGIIGMCELLGTEDLESGTKDRLQVVTNSAEALLRIINDILDFSRIEAGKMNISKEVFGFSKLLHATCLSFDNRVHDGVQLIKDIDPTIPELQENDAGRIQQILINLGLGERPSEPV